MRTEDLLEQSQSLAKELQSRQQELQTTNKELQEKAQLLVEQNQEVESKNQEVEQARQALEDKAKQLALTSQLQVRIPCQYVARVAHAAQQPADPVRPALPEQGGQPLGQADGVRQDDPFVGQRPVDAHQRHPRSVEDRIRHGRCRRERAALRRSAALLRAHLPARRGIEERRLPRRASTRACRSPWSRT